MGTIAQQLERLLFAKASIKSAIEAKGVTVSSSAKLNDYPALIENIQSGPVEEKDVNFRDYDGTIVASYTKSEFANLQALPDNPTHTGLTAQGWNWSLADAKAYVANHGRLEVGQMYITSDGATKIHITLQDGRLSPYLGFGVNGSATIDWGDGSAAEIVTGSDEETLVQTPHTYASAGDYVINILPAEGSTIEILCAPSKTYSALLGDTGADYGPRFAYRNAIRKIFLGSNVNTGVYSFSSLTQLESITIPNSITNINSCAFMLCYAALSYIVLPIGVVFISDYAFDECYSLKNISLPNTVEGINEKAFYNCYSLQSIIIPDSVTWLRDEVFDGCYTLSTVVLSDNITNIGSDVFDDCWSLSQMNLPINNDFYYIDDWFYYSALYSINIPNNITHIVGSAFQGCHFLTDITLPNSITCIDSNAFDDCCSLKYCRILATTPPELGPNVFSNTPADFVIYVPAASVDAYKAATNWSAYASQIQAIPS